jgi:hypothetical protein
MPAEMDGIVDGLAAQAVKEVNMRCQRLRHLIVGDLRRHLVKDPLHVVDAASQPTI